MRRLPARWKVEPLDGGFKVVDSNGQSLAYVYGRKTKADADIANVLTVDEARRIASNIAKLPNYLAANPDTIKPIMKLVRQCGFSWRGQR